MERREKGKQGEALAEAYLRGKGYSILAQNYRFGRYEADLVAEDGGILVFVEVKARSNQQYGPGREAVNQRKRMHIVYAAQGYISRHRCENQTVRFDVAEVNLTTSRVLHIVDAFRL